MSKCVYYYDDRGAYCSNPANPTNFAVDGSIPKGSVVPSKCDGSLENCPLHSDNDKK